MATVTAHNKWSCPTCTFDNHLSRQTCEMCATHRPHIVQQTQPHPTKPSKSSKSSKASKKEESPAKASNTIANSAFKFKKFIPSTTKLFGGKTTNTNENTNSNSNSNSFFQSNNNNSQNTKSVEELLEDIEILRMQKADLRKLVQERTYQLDQMKKLDGEHQKLRQRWKDNEEKAINDVQNAKSYTEELKQELEDLKQQNALLQSKQTNNDLIKNKLENKLRERLEYDEKNKKLLERRTQEKRRWLRRFLN